MLFLESRPVQIRLGEISIDVTRKNIKNIYLRVHRPTGEVRISVPRCMRLDAIRKFALSKLTWIERQQAKLREQQRTQRAIPREYRDRAHQFVWGEPYLLEVRVSDAPPSIELDDNSARNMQKTRRMLLQVRPRTDEKRRRSLVDVWYRRQMRAAVPPLLARWEPRIGVKAQRFYLRRMKTLWGSCNTKAQTIRLNTELAKQPPQYLEYVVVHELVHLLEPSHNGRFHKLMDRFMPDWRLHRQELNRVPLGR